MSATTTTPPKAADTYERPTTVKTTNREAWLAKAADLLMGRVVAAGGEKPKKLRVSCGWPSRGALKTASSQRRTLGQAWYSSTSEDGAREVFISPALAEECRVLDVLLHELIHTALPADAGHGPAFQAIMRAVGLEGKPTATVAGEGLLAELKVLAHELGRYPHEKLDLEPGPKKPGRMVKGSCPDCGTILYGSRAAWDNATPDCGVCGTPYVVEPSPEQAAHWGLAPAADGAEKLRNVATTVELETTDGRFALRSTKVGKVDGTWIVTDHEAIEVGRRTVTQLDDEGQEVEAEVVEYEPRVAARRTREDALAFVAAIRSGELEWDDVELEDDEDDEDFDEADLGELGDWTAEDDDLWLGEDEEETPDYPEDMPLEGDVPEGLTNVERAKLFTTRPATEAEYAEVERLRDASGARKSEEIASGAEKAMD